MSPQDRGVGPAPPSHVLNRGSWWLSSQSFCVLSSHRGSSFHEDQREPEHRHRGPEDAPAAPGRWAVPRVRTASSQSGPFPEAAPLETGLARGVSGFLRPPQLLCSWVTVLTIAKGVFSGKVRKYFSKLPPSSRNEKKCLSCFVLLLKRLFWRSLKNKIVCSSGPGGCRKSLPLGGRWAAVCISEPPSPARSFPGARPQAGRRRAGSPVEGITRLVCPPDRSGVKDSSGL